MKEKILTSGYLQVDESPIKVLDKNKPQSNHQGYQWVYHSPEKKLLIFNYRKGRGMHGPKELLSNYQGYLQCDGYGVYDKIGKKPGINLAGCIVHARLKFYEAKANDKKRAAYALEIFGLIYKLEKQTKEMSVSDHQELRDEKIKPLLLKLKAWVDDQAFTTLPKSPIGKAMTYFVNQWPKLIALMSSGRIELDNNLIEIKIRPLALGRKNYLFAGSHGGAQRIAIIYSFFWHLQSSRYKPL